MQPNFNPLFKIYTKQNNYKNTGKQVQKTTLNFKTTEFAYFSLTAR